MQLYQLKFSAGIKKLVLFLLVLAGVFVITKLIISNIGFVETLLEKKKVNVFIENNSEPVLAEFSFQTNTPNRIFNSFAHYTLKLYNKSALNIESDEIVQISDSIPLLITIETWGANRISSYFNNVLNEVVEGKFDGVIKELCSELIGTKKNVFVRFNPEMEVPAYSYPWQWSGGPNYNSAFQHFSKTVKKYAPLIKVVWGPAGYPGTMECYPGDEFVDAATVTVLSGSEMSLDVYPKNYPVAYDMFRRLHRLRFIDKPIFVLGSKNAANDSITKEVVAAISQKIDEEKDLVYSTENFVRSFSIHQVPKPGEFEIGLYDPQSLLVGEKPVTVEHLFADFSNLNDGTFQKAFNKVVERNHNAIVTFEPFRIPGREDDLLVLQNITDGKYDKEIDKFYSILLTTKLRVYLRFAHEMEIPITRYPWQSQDPVTYIKSFRYFMNFQTPLPANIKRVWGPAGDRGSIEWWPGNDVVDFVSIAIYGLPDKNITDPEKQESFSTIFNRKYWRLRFIDKPIFITEFGVKGPEVYQNNWLEGAAKVIRENPQIVGINYFNMSDTPKAWGEIKPPDWSITKKTFYNFIEKLEEE